MTRTLLATMFAVLAGCSTDPTPQLADIGLACDSDHPCPGGTECGTCGIGTGQCIVPCSMSGSAGCPMGSYCSEAFTDLTTHICVRECDQDSDCKTPTNNNTLSCNDPYTEPGVEHDDLFICNVPNSIASANTCP